MSESQGPTSKKPPEISPYVMTALLAGFGLWCAYDGWFNSAPEIQEHLLFNRIAGGVLLPWAVIDFLRVRKRERGAAVGEARGDSGK